MHEKSRFGQYFPELGAGGFSRFDGSVEFYGRINSLLSDEFDVLDFGAGRGAWLEEDGSSYGKSLRTIKGKVRRVVGQDIDPAIYSNQAVDYAIMTAADSSLPFEAATFDLVIADFVFEHVTNPERVSLELARLLKPGGWLCARTPNKWGYVSIATRLIRNSQHATVLRCAQPGRKAIDIFPTAFELNTMSSISKYFPPARFENFSYYYQAEPSYHFNSRLMLQAMTIADRLLPSYFWSSLFIFLRKKA